MASGTNYTKYAAPSPATFMGAEWGGKVRATHDTYTFASAAADTEVNVGVLMASVDGRPSSREMAPRRPHA